MKKTALLDALNGSQSASVLSPAVLASDQDTRELLADIMLDTTAPVDAREKVVLLLRQLAEAEPQYFDWVTRQLALYIDSQPATPDLNQAAANQDEDEVFNEGYDDEEVDLDPPSQTPVPDDLDNDGLFLRLQEHLDYYGHEFSITTVSGLDGFFTALSCAQPPLSPEIWLPAIWGGEDFMPEFPSAAELTIFVQLVMKLHNQNFNHVRETDKFVAAFMLDEESGAGLVTEQGRILVEDWCDGFLRGAVLGEKPIIEVPDITDLLRPMALFGSDDGYEKLKHMTVEQVADWQQEIEPNVLLIRNAVFAHTQQKTVIRDFPKVGRNDLCPCGSGKKYKKCHLNRGVNTSALNAR